MDAEDLGFDAAVGDISAGDGRIFADARCRRPRDRCKVAEDVSIAAAVTLGFATVRGEHSDALREE